MPISTRKQQPVNLPCDEELEDFKEDYVELEVRCTSEYCPVWTTILIPKKLGRKLKLLKEPFCCGFCTAKFTNQLMDQLKNENNPITAVETKSYAEIVNKVQSENTQQQYRAKNLVVLGTTPETDEKDVLFAKKLLEDLIIRL